ncbi:uncharacterized protein LOC133202041 [Saccostrea echinata]|uniref:uncharacterized protein LOC133202041 n=1 Tax=Saccostrea echinata TaxID=191078 RepID=UPI002A82C9F4|nr:uncharacterized protein LOC133202041 [Saccostrea echinata]
MEKQPEKIDLQEKEQVLSYIKILSAIGLFLGICSVGIGIAVLALMDGADYPLTTGTGIWFAANPIAFGIVGIAAAMSTNEITQKKLLTGHYVTGILLITQGYAFTTAIQGVIECSNGSEKCGSNADAKAALRGVLIGIIFFAYVVGSVSMGIHSKKKHVLHPDWKGRGCCGSSSD